MLLFPLENVKTSASLAEFSVLTKWKEIQTLYSHVMTSIDAGKDLRLIPIHQTAVCIDDLHDYLCVIINEGVVLDHKIDEWMKFADALIELRLNISNLEGLSSSLAV